MALPSTLQDAMIYFADPKNCNEFFAGLRWTDGKPRCPHCGSDNVTYLASQSRYKCYGKHAKAQFSLKVGTILEDSPIGLDKWLCAMWLIVNSKNGISSCEMARDLGITQKSAWFLDYRIRFALFNGSVEKLSGHCEADETFIGGKARNMHVAHRQRRITGTGTKDKIAVMGNLERGKDGRSRVRASTIEIKNYPTSTASKWPLHRLSVSVSLGTRSLARITNRKRGVLTEKERKRQNRGERKS